MDLLSHVQEFERSVGLEGLGLDWIGYLGGLQVCTFLTGSGLGGSIVILVRSWLFLYERLELYSAILNT